jgi:hypothetical protein
MEVFCAIQNHIISKDIDFEILTAPLEPMQQKINRGFNTRSH